MQRVRIRLRMFHRKLVPKSAQRMLVLVHLRRRIHSCTMTATVTCVRGWLLQWVCTPVTVVRHSRTVGPASNISQDAVQWSGLSSAIYTYEIVNSSNTSFSYCS